MNDELRACLECGAQSRRAAADADGLCTVCAPLQGCAKAREWEAAMKCADGFAGLTSHEEANRLATREMRRLSTTQRPVGESVRVETERGIFEDYELAFPPVPRFRSLPELEDENWQGTAPELGEVAVIKETPCRVTTLIFHSDATERRVIVKGVPVRDLPVVDEPAAPPAPLESAS